jgi:colicin import membrane protein
MSAEVLDPIAPHSAGAAKDPFRFGWRWITRIGPDGEEIDEQVGLTEWDVLHPKEGDFIVNTRIHQLILNALFNRLAQYLKNRPQTLVLSDHRVDWGIPGVHPHGPDIAVFDEIDPNWFGDTATIYLDREKARPLLAIEVTSPHNKKNDLVHKVHEYCEACIPFYLIVDIQDDPVSGKPVVELLGYERVLGEFEPIVADPERGIWIPSVNLWFQPAGDRVNCLDEDGRRLPEESDWIELAATERARADAEMIRADEERLRAETEQVRAEEEHQRAEEERLRAAQQEKRAEEERQRAEEERQRAEEERQRAEAAEKRITELEARLKELSKRTDPG